MEKLFLFFRKEKKSHHSEGQQHSSNDATKKLGSQHRDSTQYIFSQSVTHRRAQQQQYIAYIKNLKKRKRKEESN